MDNKWKRCKDVMPPLGEEVLILYKNRTDELKQENLFYGVAKRWEDDFGCERWSFYAQYPGYHEAVYWMPLPNMPIDWYDIPAEEMTLEQAKQAVKDLRKICLKSIVESEKINCKTTKCQNCKNHNYCDYEPQESEDKK